ncbi:MAG: heparin lyase I family protein [Hyphomicrobiales bacterium]
MAASAAPDYDDTFEEGVIDQSLWSTARLPPERAWIFKGDARTGEETLAIRVKGTDYDKDCECQRVELREADKVRVPFGEERWYAFSFRMEGQPPANGDQRWVITAWKQDVQEGSPFLAQRFDQGVFHITLESLDTRVLLATSKIPAKSFPQLLKDGLGKTLGFVSDQERYAGQTDVKLEYGPDPILPDPRLGWVDMVYRVKGDLHGNGVVEVFANDKFIVRATGTIGVAAPEPVKEYLKLGHNRSPMPGTSTIFFDNVRRGATRADVEP